MLTHRLNHPKKMSWNHEWTRINTNKVREVSHDQQIAEAINQKTAMDTFAIMAKHMIRVNSCPFVVSKTEPKPTAEFRINVINGSTHLFRINANLGLFVFVLLRAFLWPKKRVPAALPDSESLLMSPPAAACKNGGTDQSMPLLFSQNMMRLSIWK